jgi:hypothetical protein
VAFQGSMTSIDTVCFRCSIRDEFKQHKSATKAEADVFLTEWTSYAITLAKQLSKRTAFQSFGVDLSENQLESFREEQIGQLWELFEESTKPPES